jgi:DNA-binding PadR family transcriptional regulator
MSRTLKRGSDALNNVRDDTPEGSNPPPRRRQRSSSASASETSQPDEAQQEGSSHETYVKKLVRLSLAAEYSRNPIRRTDISAKVFSGANSRSFKKVFDDAQKILMDTFGLQLVELPTREKTSLKDRRAQATQMKGPGATSSKSWILLSILPAAYKSNPAIVRPAQAPTVEAESSYTALYTFILSLIYLNNGALPDGKMDRYLKRVNIDTYTPIGSIEKLMQRMSKEGYIEKRRDTSSGEEVVDWVPGPRGRMEVGAKGVAGLVQRVYAGAEGEEDDELTGKLERSLGIKLQPQRGEDEEMGDAEAEEVAPAQQQKRLSRRTRRDESGDD